MLLGKTGSLRSIAASQVGEQATISRQPQRNDATVVVGHFVDPDSGDKWKVAPVRFRLTKGDENPAKLGEGGITAERVNLASIQYCWFGFSTVRGAEK